MTTLEEEYQRFANSQILTEKRTILEHNLSMPYEDALKMFDLLTRYREALAANYVIIDLQSQGIARRREETINDIIGMLKKQIKDDSKKYEQLKEKLKRNRT